jgi:hypothetical protein
MVFSNYGAANVVKAEEPRLVPTLTPGSPSFTQIYLKYAQNIKLKDPGKVTSLKRPVAGDYTELTRNILFEE